MITGVNTIRNGIENGYPLIESILSLLPLVDEYLINDGGSTDGTLEALNRLQLIHPKLTIYEIPDSPSIRWDCVSDVINHLMDEAGGDWVMRTDADELIHEQDVSRLKQAIENHPHRIMRFDRREIVNNWRGITQDYYPPARVAKKLPGLRQDWNRYGGDEYLYGSEWIDPNRELTPTFLLYHLHSVFQDNMLNKRRNDAEWLAPGDRVRTETYERLKEGKTSKYVPPHPDDVYPDLPALARGLVTLGSYRIREELFDVSYVSELTGLEY